MKRFLRGFHSNKTFYPDKMSDPPNLSRYSFQTRKNLYDAMTNLSREDCEIVLTILRQTGEPYSENSNGIFMDLNQAKDETIDLLLQYFN